MNDRVLFTINRRDVFSLADAQRTLPVVRRITLEYRRTVDLLIARLETLQLNQTETICALEKQVNELVQQWNDKVRKLGAVPRGLWVVDFDCGQGYYSWKYPEPEILYWHSTEDGIAGRQLLNAKVQVDAHCPSPD